MAAALVTVKPGSMRELHWHPNADEWQYYLKGSARMTVFNTGPHANTSDFRAGDVGLVRRNCGHYVENTGDDDLVFIETFRSAHYEEVVELYARMFVDLITDVVMLCATQADRDGNLFAGPSTEDRSEYTEIR